MADSRAANGIRVAVAGAGGRMGRALVEAVVAHPGLVLAAALDVPGSPALGHDAGPMRARNAEPKNGNRQRCAAKHPTGNHRDPPRVLTYPRKSGAFGCARGA